jgi:hypothetical protein
MTEIFSAVGGALALTAGIHSMGATAATLAGVSLAVPPIGMIVAGVAFMLFAAYLSLRVTCVTKIDTFIEAQTKNERAELEWARSQLIQAIESFESQSSLHTTSVFYRNCVLSQESFNTAEAMLYAATKDAEEQFMARIKQW